MRRLLRWAFNGAATLSAALFVATCVLWARSYAVSDEVNLNWNRIGPDHVTVAYCSG